MNAYLDAASAFLFKHQPGEFARGELIFAPALRPSLLVALVLLAAVLALVAVAGIRGVRIRDRVVLGTLRLLALLLIGFCLMRPTLVLSRAIAQRNVLALVYDDSRSMNTADHGSGSRLAALQATFADSGTLLSALRERFVLRTFRLGSDGRPIGSVGELTGRGARSDIGAGLEAAREALADQPLAGIVLVSDGAENGLTDLDGELRRLVDAGIPVHTVGVGRERFEVDVGIDALTLPTEVLLGSVAPAEVTLRVRGVTGRRLVVTTELGARLASVDTVLVPPDRDLVRVPLQLPVRESGSIPVHVRVAPVSGEVTEANNRASGVLQVRAGPEKILYVEGEPRSELPFIRRAVAHDTALQVVALIRTAEGKYLRLGVDDSLELRDGFPATREELFGYRAVVLGSVPASFFAPGAARMLQEFVSVRGGGLLALGGRSSLAEGGYAGTPVGEVLPVELSPTTSGSGDSARAAHVRIEPAPGPAGAAFSLGRVQVSAWDSLPDLTVVNAVGRVRPGAVTVLEGRATTSNVVYPALVTQRFGLGHSGVFLPQDSWRWQMAEDLPPNDLTHQAFWTRLLRWTVSGVPDRVELEVVPATGAPGEAVRLRVAVADSLWNPRDDARVTVRVTPPDADSYEVGLSNDIGVAGEFVGSFVPASEGIWRLDALAVVGGDSMRVSRLAIASSDADDPGSMERDQATLDRIAMQTGGHSYDIDQLGALPDDVAITESGITAKESSDLWDAPAIFLLMVILLAADWAWRRSRGLG